MTLQQLHYVITITEMGSFNKAQLFLTVPEKELRLQTTGLNLLTTRDSYIAVPLEEESDSDVNNMEIGYIVKKDIILSSMGELYIREIDRYLKDSVK